MARARPHHVILVGGGHTHALTLAALARRPEPDLRVTLISESRFTPYSGMLPGHVAGFYEYRDMHIDLQALAARAGASFLCGRVRGVDATRNEVSVEGAGPTGYDTLSINVGATPDVSGIEGAAQRALLVKPIAGFLERLEPTLAAAERAGGPRRFAVVGAGPAGIELACALRTRLDAVAARCGAEPSRFAVTLAGDGLAPSLNERARRLAAAALRRRGVAVETSFRAVAISPDGVRAADGRFIPAQAMLVASAARAPAWLAASGLPCGEDGSLRTSRTLQVVGFDGVFAVGDCARIEGHAREKAGVFAVRQAPTLTANLVARATGAPMRSHRPQSAFLTLLSTGDGRAIAARGGWFAAEGALAWRWKDRIDRRFMAQFA
ncbi:MAG: FAD-dependent oxidoreductase [Rhizobiales bacterium]|nr:FAD-dependent oxidoreductase [Hyphomicrobiales bacterium]